MTMNEVKPLIIHEYSFLLRSILWTNNSGESFLNRLVHLGPRRCIVKRVNTRAFARSTPAARYTCRGILISPPAFTCLMGRRTQPGLRGGRKRRHANSFSWVLRKLDNGEASGSLQTAVSRLPSTRTLTRTNTSSQRHRITSTTSSVHLSLSSE